MVDLGHRKIGQNKKMEDREEYGEHEQIAAYDSGRRGGGVNLRAEVGRFYGWPSSRIVRVTRTSGGKDRHSKVLTSRGLRDRRVRLSVNTAIQFYDLQDRLGYDQPSKAVEWLLKAAESSIAELPPMNTLFLDTPMSDEKRSSTAGSDQVGLDTTADADMDASGEDPSYLPKSSACSSNSETSKGSGLSLSRSENRIKARERAKERVAEKEKDQTQSCQVPSLNPNSQITSFTELLSGGFDNVHNSNGSVQQTPNRDINESTFFQKSPRQWSSASMDYFANGLLGGQMQFAHSLKRKPGYYNSELQSLDFGQHQFVSVGGNSVTNGDNHHNGESEYSLNFDISSSGGSAGLAGFSRGTLQSNTSSSHSLPPVYRFSPTDGSPTSFLIGAVENHHQFPSGFDARLQLFYGADADGKGGKNAEQKKKGKN